MRIAAVVVGALLAAPAVAAAAPLTLGASAGLLQSSKDADNGYDSQPTVALWGRLGLASQFSLQLEVQRVSLDQSTLRGGTLLFAFDLARPRPQAANGQLVPVLLAGGGTAWETRQYSDTLSERHFEAGVALEYRAPGGFLVGIDARIGTRNVDQPVYYAQPVDTSGGGALRRQLPYDLSDGQYRSVRASVGVRF